MRFSRVVAVSCFWSFVSLGQLHADSLPSEALASFPPFTEDALVPLNPATQEILDGSLRLADQAIAYTLYEQRLADSAIVTDLAFADEDAEALFLGLRIQSRAPLSGYVLDLSRNGDVSLVQLVSGDDTVLATGNVGFSPNSDTVSICYRLIQQTLTAWVWPKGTPQPTEPSITANLGLPTTFTEGRPLIGVRGGAARYDRLEIYGSPYRPLTLDFLPLAAEVRIRISWPSEPGRVYRIDSSQDRVVWSGLYLVKATETLTEPVIATSFTAVSGRFSFFRVVDVASNTEVQGNPFPLVPATPRLAIVWRSAEDRVYGFEWSQDLETWNRYPGLAVPGADGRTLTDTVLPLPEGLSRNDADRIYLRVLDLDDDAGFGITPVVVEP